MSPRIICHMISTIDGKIDGAAFRKVTGANDYEKTAEELNSNAWICGRTTMQLHFADKDPFVSATNRAAGSQPVHVASQADSYAIVVDTTGRLRWSEDNIDGDHLICIVSEQATDDYLELLRSKGISYIVSGATAVDLLQAMDLLGLHFAVRNLLLEGGGHINGGFLQADLVDEVSLLIAPAIDGRSRIPAVFDGLGANWKESVTLTLKSFEQLRSKVLWLRYEVVRAD